MNHMFTDTAHPYWNAEWQKPCGTSPWAMPEPWVIDHVGTLPPGSRIQDLGAGIGRHALAFAEAGHRVTALDASEAAMAAVAAAAFTCGPKLETVQAPMTDLPFEAASFMATMLSARRLPVEQAKTRSREISCNTWVFEGEGDKVHPHCFCTAPDLLSLMWGFEVFTLFDRPHEKPGSWHWHLLAERLA